MYHLNLGIFNILFPAFGSGRIGENNAHKLEVSLFISSLNVGDVCMFYSRVFFLH